MDGRSPRVTGPLTRRQKQTMAAVGAFAVVAMGGVSIWAASHPGAYGRSHGGCITVSMPSSTGGAIIHGCGAQAQAMCRTAFARHDELARLTRPQCRLAGLSPAAPSAR